MIMKKEKKVVTWALASEQALFFESFIHPRPARASGVPSKGCNGGPLKVP
jgi:hypothetical protein